MKTRQRLPKVFVGHPFSKFPYRKFRQFFQALPFRVIYANTDIETRQLLQILKKYINQADYSIFDLSDWNANVALELGLSEGLARKAKKSYYILLNTRRRREVPADIRGLQRLEYSRYDFRSGSGLGDSLLSLLKKESWVQGIISGLRDQLHEAEKREKALLIAMKMLGHVKDGGKLFAENLGTIIRGTHLRKESVNKILDVLQKLKFLKKGRGRSYARGTRLFT